MSTAVVALLSALVVAILNVAFSLWLNTSQTRQKHREDRLETIRERLSSFYGPVTHLLVTNRNTYEQLKEGKSAEFVLLTALLTGYDFAPNDKALIEQILKINSEVDALIYSRAGLVADESLRKLRCKASAHYRLIAVSSDGQISGEPKRFAGSSYPFELNGALERATNELLCEEHDLRSTPGSRGAA